MHDSSMEIMTAFSKAHDFKGATVIDIGSRDLNGTYRDLFPESRYLGVDIVAGLNVDILMDSPEWAALENVDAAISGQTLEHVADIPKLMESLFKVLKPGGLLCIIAPSAGPPHDYPVWVGHFSIERMTSIVEAAGFEIIDCTIGNVEPFLDCCCIAQKPQIETKGFNEDI